jgi:hypothetical protein
MYPADEQTKKVANEVIAEAKPKVFEIELSCAEECGVVADLKIVTIARATHVRFFLEPGPHDLVVSFGGDRAKELKVEATPGGNKSLTVEPPPVQPVKPVEPPPEVEAPPEAPRATPSGVVTVQTAPPARRVAPTRQKPLGPVVFATLGGLSLVAGGLTIASGIDASNDPGPDAVRQSCVGFGEACPEYQRGRDKQLRTNVALAVTGVLAVSTAAVGIFFTRWSGSKARPSVGLAPGGGEISIQGSF